MSFFWPNHFFFGALYSGARKGGISSASSYIYACKSTWLWKICATFLSQEMRNYPGSKIAKNQVLIIPCTASKANKKIN